MASALCENGQLEHLSPDGSLWGLGHQLGAGVPKRPSKHMVQDEEAQLSFQAGSRLYSL